MNTILNYFGAKIALADGTAPVTKFVGTVNKLIVNPLIILMFAAALVYFLYGVFEFLMNADQAEARETGKDHIIWGIIGMFVMLGVFTILHLIERTIGAPTNTNIPS